MTITYRAEYSGHVDDERVAWTYRAYNEEGAPYVLVLGTDNDVSTIVQAPTEFLDGVVDEEADREHAIHWVHRLTELVDKVKAFDHILDLVATSTDTDDMVFDIQAAVDNFHDLHVVEDDDDWDDEDELAMTANIWLPSGPSPIEAYTVDELTDLEVDSEWSDYDGDHYKFIDSEWYISESDGTEPWFPVTKYANIGNLLTRYGPYTAVTK